MPVSKKRKGAKVRTGEMSKKILTNESSVKKEFKYNLDGCHLDFTLRIDVKKELVAFKEILNKAIADVEEELAEF